MDIKQQLDLKKYQKIVGLNCTYKILENIKKSIILLLKGKIDYEFRTTIVKEFHSEQDIIEICKNISQAKIYYLQNLKKTDTISNQVFTPFSKEEIVKIIKKCQNYLNIKERSYL